MWDHTIATLHSLDYIGPDLVLLLKQERSWFKIDVVVPLDRSIVKKSKKKAITMAR